MSKFRTRLSLNNQNFIQESGDTLNLSGNTIFFKPITIPSINHGANNFVISGTTGTQRQVTGNGTNSAESIFNPNGQLRLRSITTLYGTKIIDLSNTGNTIIVRTDGGSLKYAANYAGNFTARSVPDAGFLTGNTFGIANNGLTGITGSGVRTIGLGGKLGRDTTIDVDGNVLSLIDDDASIGFTVDGGSDEISMSHSDVGNLSFIPTGAIFTDTRGTKKGIQYAGDYTSTFDQNSLITKKYVTGVTSTLVTKTEFNQYTGSTGDIYDGATPATIAVGGISAGTQLTGKTANEILEQMLVVYQAPAFSSFSVTGQATTVEVGTALNGSRTFTWGTTNSGNVQTNSLAIRDVTSGTTIATSQPNDGTQVVTINSRTLLTNNATQSWRIEGTNTQAGSFQSSNFTVTGIHPYFWGKVASGGAPAGSNRPTATAALVTGGTKVVASSTGTITITFNSTSDDYIWFAIPNTSTSKTVWYVSALNNGSIGGAVSPGGNLFPAFSTVSVTTVMWAGVSYKVYISNFQSATTGAMEMRNT